MKWLLGLCWGFLSPPVLLCFNLMSFRRSLFILCAVSLISGVVFIFAGLAWQPDRGRGAFAALITSDAVPDREIRRRLGDSLISESSQWFFLDDFGAVARVPLDEYDARLLPLDPRNDGYADKLRSFFVRDGKRFSFIPLNVAAGGAPVKMPLEKSLPLLLEGIPFALEFPGLGRPLGVFFVIFAGAAALLLCVRFLPARWRVETAELVFCLPALVFFGFAGAAGFVLCALLAGLAALVREPLREFFVMSRCRDRVFFSGETAKGRFWRNVFQPFKLNWLLAPVFAGGFLCVLLFTVNSLLMAVAAFLVFAAIFVFSVRAFSLPRDSGRHMRFVPVALVKNSLNPVFAAVMLPFVAAALAAGLSACAAPRVSDPAGLSSLEGELVTEADYLAHAAFQASFSYRPLGRSGGDYLLYTRSGDGLVAPSDAVREPLPDVPPFPLKGLMDFLFSRRTGKDLEKVLFCKDDL